MTTPQQQAFNKAYNGGITDGITMERKRIAKLLDKILLEQAEWSQHSVAMLYAELQLLEPVPEYDPNH
jgi:hypothetical protein